MVGDPDDHRPNTTWRLAVDPAPRGALAELSFLEERCAPGDHAVFPARTVLMEMLERNPAPGTEGDAPLTTRYDFVTGEFEILGPTRR